MTANNVHAQELLPHSIAAEEAVIGSVLIDSDALPALVGKLRMTDF